MFAGVDSHTATAQWISVRDIRMRCSRFRSLPLSSYYRITVVDYSSCEVTLEA